MSLNLAVQGRGLRFQALISTGGLAASVFILKLLPLHNCFPSMNKSISIGSYENVGSLTHQLEER